jgi:hypothetical protein
MQTLIDPFELASRDLPPLPREAIATPTPPPPLRTDGPSEIVDEPPILRDANPDSSARLRCWCSED